MENENQTPAETPELTVIKTDTLKAFVRTFTGLSVPVSLSMPLGKAREGWDQVRERLNLFGWNTDDEVLKAIVQEVEQGGE